MLNYKEKKDMYRFCIVDDDKNIRDELLSFLKQYSQEENLEISIDCFEDANKFLKQDDEYDLIFMDIEIGDLNGIDVVKSMREKKIDTIVIFISYLASYAVDGYSVDGFDFIVKPLNYYEFSLKMKRAMNNISKEKNVVFHVHSRGEIYKIESNKLKYVEVINHTIIFHMLDENITINSSLKEVKEKLAGADFALCNQCYLVNLNFVESINKNTVKVKDEELRISVPRRKEFENTFLEFLKRKA